MYELGGALMLLGLLLSGIAIGFGIVFIIENLGKKYLLIFTVLLFTIPAAIIGIKIMNVPKYEYESLLSNKYEADSKLEIFLSFHPEFRNKEQSNER